MRFGIMAMQLNLLLPPEALSLPFEQAVGRILGLQHADLVRQLAHHGFKLIEIGGDLSLLLPHTFSPASIEGLVSLKEELGLNYTVHLPLWSVEPSTMLTPVREGSVQALVQAIQMTLPLHPEVYVLHATGGLAGEFYRMRLPELGREVMMRRFQGEARQSLREIIQRTGIHSRQLAIETVEFPFEMTLELAEELDTSFCLDTGHILVGYSGPIELFDALERCLPRLGEIHLHDGPWQGPNRNIAYFKDHQPLGAGDLDVLRLLSRLDQAGFTGPIIFELQVHEAVASLQLIRERMPGIVS